MQEETTGAAGSGMTVAGIKISNPDKVIFEDPEITKADVVRYYAEVSERMIPYVSGRILSIVRCPRGISQTCFLRSIRAGQQGHRHDAVTNSKGETEENFYIMIVPGWFMKPRWARWSSIPGEAASTIWKNRT